MLQWYLAQTVDICRLPRLLGVQVYLRRYLGSRYLQVVHDNRISNLHEDRISMVLTGFHIEMPALTLPAPWTNPVCFEWVKTPDVGAKVH